MKTIDDARELRRRIFGAFEMAEAATDPDVRAKLLTIVIVGAGPTGVELAGQVRELAVRCLKDEYRAFDPASVRVLLIDGGKEPLAGVRPRALGEGGRRAQQARRRAAMGARVVGVDAQGVDVAAEDGTRSRIEAFTTIWAAGVQASPLAAKLAEASGAELDRAGRISVLPDLSIPGHPEVFAVGDMAALDDLPGVAEVAMQGGLHAANTILRRLRGEAGLPFRYRDLGSVATIGRFRAIASFGKVRLSGFPAWVVWFFVHLAFLSGYGNRRDDDGAMAPLDGRARPGRAGVQHRPHRRRPEPAGRHQSGGGAGPLPQRRARAASRRWCRAHRRDDDAGVKGRPNLLLFMPDQLRADALGCFGSSFAHTPNFDGLAARGVRCTDAWSQHSVCGPSRVSMMTGWYPHVQGHRTLDNLIKPWEPNLLAILRDAGYHVAIAGNRGDVFAPGVTEASTDFSGWLEPPSNEASMRRYTASHPEDHPLFRAMYFGSGGDEPVVDMDEATIRTAERWLEEGAPTDRPWALWVPLLFPHPPFTVEEPWFSMHDRAAMPDPVPVAGPGKPGFMAAYRAAYGWDGLTPDHVREIMATYHGMVSRVDDQLGRLLRAVDAIGASRGHGGGGVHRSRRVPRRLRSGREVAVGSRSAACCGTRSSSRAAASPRASCSTSRWRWSTSSPRCASWPRRRWHTPTSGGACSPRLGDPDALHRTFACAEGGFRISDVALFEAAGWIYQPKADLQRSRPELVGTAMVLRTETHTYVHRRYEGDELYDRIADPAETANLINRPELVATAGELRDLLLGWLADSSDVIPWQPDPRFPEVPQGWR